MDQLIDTESTIAAYTQRIAAALEEGLAPVQAVQHLQEVATDGEAGIAATARNAIAAFVKRVEAEFDPIKDGAFRTHRAICELEKKGLHPARTELDRISGMLGRFAERERRRREDLARAEAEAARKVAEEKRLEAALAIIDSGHSLEAEELLDAPIEPVPVPKIVAPIKIAGMVLREQWLFEITDETALPRKFLVANPAAIRAEVQALKERASIPGVRIYRTTAVASAKGI